VICDKTSHIYLYEGGGVPFNSGVSLRLINGDRGRITASDIVENINPDNVHFPITRLVSLENTCNKGGGCYYSLSEIETISKACMENQLALHLDGARIFNALVATGDDPFRMGQYFDTISVCLSKGLGAPIGSVLVGTKSHIKKARRIRKVLGGGMRQAGILAAAGIYALDNNIKRLEEDHRRAKAIAETLKDLPFVKSILPVETNIIVYTLIDEVSTESYLKILAENNIKAVEFGKQMIRMVTHLDFTDEMLNKLLKCLKNLSIKETH